MRDPPAAHNARKPLIRVVIQHRHPGAGKVQLLDCAQADRVQPADDHMIDPVSALL